MSFLITPADLPGADLAADVRLSAGRGWLPLVREALAELGDLKILAIREDAGALVIDTTRCSDAQRVRLAALRAASLHVCELCGLPGELVYEGTKGGHPAGWHRTRCASHRNWRTCPPFPLDQAIGLLDSETEAAARRFLSLLGDRYDIAGALLYGSRARGTHHSDSDADLAVILRGEPQRVLPTALEMSDAAYEVLLETGINVAPLPVWLDEWTRPETHRNPALLRQIAAEGIPVATEPGSSGWRFASVLFKAEAVLGDRQAVFEWMRTPAIGLNRSIPIDLLSSQAGYERVDDYLSRIERGVYT